MTQHIVKMHKRHFDAVNNGIKTFEILKDRGYAVGDTIKFVCVDDYGDTMTVPNFKTEKDVELRCFVAIQYIQTSEDLDNLLEDGYIIVGFRKSGV